MKDDIKDEFISFRVSSEAYQRILERAQLQGESANEYCRKMVMSESAKGGGMTAGERLIFEQAAIIRFMLGRYLRIVLPTEAFDKLHNEVEQRQIKIADRILEKRLAMKDE
jgi:hypothetical protein